MNWEERKVIDAKPYIYARKIKETIHSIKDKNHINSISYDLPEIWIPINLNLNWDKLTTNNQLLLYLNIYTKLYPKLHQGANIVNTVYPNGNKANFQVKTIYSGKRSIHFARLWEKYLSKHCQT